MEKEYPLNRETVWNLLSDTDRLNRIIGLFSVTFKPAEKVAGKTFHREALAKVGGVVPLKWREYPFQWEKYENYMVERAYGGGPLKHFRGGIELGDSDITLPDGGKGTRVRLIGEFTPRNVIGIAAVQLTGVQSMKNTMKYLDDYLELIDEGVETPLIGAIKVKANLDKLKSMEEQLINKPVNPLYIARLKKLLITGDNSEVTKMQPIEIARRWGVNSQEVIRLFLYATKVGLVNLSWNLICPNCRVSKVEYTSLTKLQEQFHCDLCGINYNANFGKYVELTFTVHPSIRVAHDNTYCVGGPMISPHVEIQQVITSGKSYKLMLPSNVENLRVRILQANHILTFQKSSLKDQKEHSIEYTEKGWSDKEIEVGPDTSFIQIVNSTHNEIIFVLEKNEWSKDVLTAAMVTSMQEFRDLFSAEVLSPGQQVGIENVTILFSDLQDSTNLYELVGDADAYGHVRRHFEFLTHWISENSGGVVKTIGDAVMAVFHLPEDAVKAAIQIQQHISEFNQLSKDPIVLKIGLYSGPTIAVNSNNRLDYFGRTVNIAARIQGESVGNDIVFSHEYLENEDIQSFLKENLIELEQFTATLKGIEANIELVRCTI